MRTWGRALVLSVPAALFATTLTATPASADNRWMVLLETSRHVKAEACRTGTFWGGDGDYKAIVWRSDTTTASLGGSVQLQTAGGIGPYTSPWASSPQGGVSYNHFTYLAAAEQGVTLHMRVQTVNGTSGWSPILAFTSLPYC